MKLHALVIMGSMLLMSFAAQAAPKTPQEKAPTLDTAYPGVVTGALVHATLSDLPNGQVLKSGSLTVSEKELAAEIHNAPEAIRPSLEKNRLFVLDQIAARALLLRLARDQHAKSKDAATTATDQDLIGGYFKTLLAGVNATDQEIAAFYEQNKNMTGDATFEQAKDSLKPYVIEQKQQQVVAEHIRTLGRRVPIEVSASWAKEQAALAMDNPVDKARKSGLPSMIDFGAEGCRPCEMMKPILQSLKKKYDGKVNVLFVQVRDEQVLGARYGAQTIPLQVFFDKQGKEVFRHVGFFAQAEIEKKLAEMGAR